MLWEPIIQLPTVPFLAHEWFFICVVTLNVSTRCEDFCLFLFKQKQTQKNSELMQMMKCKDVGLINSQGAYV